MTGKLGDGLDYVSVGSFLFHSSMFRSQTKQMLSHLTFKRRKSVLNGYDFSFEDDEVLELDSGDTCTTL